MLTQYMYPKYDEALSMGIPVTGFLNALYRTRHRFWESNNLNRPGFQEAPTFWNEGSRRVRHIGMGRLI
jgi:hypothetical protein